MGGEGVEEGVGVGVASTNGMVALGRGGFPKERSKDRLSIAARSVSGGGGAEMEVTGLGGAAIAGESRDSRAATAITAIDTVHAQRFSLEPLPKRKRCQTQGGLGEECSLVSTG